VISIYCSRPEELFETTAALLLAEVRRILTTRDYLTLTLAGGSTPKGLYARLAEERDLPWQRVHLLWGDERNVPQDSIDSNFRMVKESLLSHINIPDENVHRVRTEIGADDAAVDYEGVVRELSQAGSPMLDIVLLGIGPDGHTASLFPAQPQLEADNLVASTPQAPREPHVRRVTMTFRLLNDASMVIFLVSGEEKTPVVRSILSRDSTSSSYPASRVQPKGKLIWAVYPPAS